MPDRDKLKRLLLSTGIIVPVSFWASTIAGGILHGDYNHFKNTISQLGAIGTRSELFMTISTWLCVGLSLCFFAGLLLTCFQLRINRLPLTGILGFAFMFGWAASFHSGNPLHSKGGASLVLLLAAPLLAVIFWRGERFRSIRRMSLISLGLMLLIFLRAIPSESIQNDWAGLVQRFVHLGWSVWFSALSLVFLKLNRSGFAGRANPVAGSGFGARKSY